MRGLLLGYACVPNEKIGPAFASLAQIIEQTSLQARRASPHAA
jgi:GntR family transcriptional regulator/MocR family aminotransferase